MQPKIVFTDVDGTLVDDDHHPMAADRPTIAAVARRVPFCLVSARPPQGLYPVQRGLEFTGPLVCFSGAYVLDEEGVELASHVICTSDALQIKSYLSHKLPDICVGTYGFHTWIVDDRSDPRVRREEYFVQTTATESSDLEASFGERGVHKFLLMGEPAAIREAQHVVSSRFPELVAVRSNETLCEIMVGGVSKAKGVELLCERYGVSPAEAVAFGDGYNDLDMLGAVGHSFAMANAKDAVKKAATDVTRWSNVASGVARTLASLFAL